MRKMSNFFVEKIHHHSHNECWIKYEDGSDKGMKVHLPEIFADEFCNLQKLVRAQQEVSALQDDIGQKLFDKGEILLQRIKNYRQNIKGEDSQGRINATLDIMNMVVELYGLQGLM